MLYMYKYLTYIFLLYKLFQPLFFHKKISKKKYRQLLNAINMPRAEAA